MKSLDELLRLAASHKMTPDEIAQQRRNWVASEMAIGDDDDERSYREAVLAGNWNRLAELNAAAEQRRVSALRAMKDLGI